MSKRERTYFNEELNKYIQSLPQEGYLEVITIDLNKILFDVMTSDDFKPEQQRVLRVSTNLIEVAKDENTDEVLAKIEQEQQRIKV